MESLLIVNIGYVYLNTNRMIFRLKRGYIKIKKWGKLIPHLSSLVKFLFKILITNYPTKLLLFLYLDPEMRSLHRSSQN